MKTQTQTQRIITVKSFLLSLGFVDDVLGLDDDGVLIADLLDEGNVSGGDVIVIFILVDEVLLRGCEVVLGDFEVVLSNIELVVEAGDFTFSLGNEGVCEEVNLSDESIDSCVD